MCQIIQPSLTKIGKLVILLTRMHCLLFVKIDYIICFLFSNKKVKMSVTSLNIIAYSAHVDEYGLNCWSIIVGNNYCYMETDGSLTDLGKCIYNECDSKICWHDGPSWWEKIKFENASEERYHICRGGSGTGSGSRLPIIEKSVLVE